MDVKVDRRKDGVPPSPPRCVSVLKGRHDRIKEVGELDNPPITFRDEGYVWGGEWMYG